VFADAYRAEDAHIAAACLGAEEPRASVEDGVRALEAVIAVNRSLTDGRPVPVEGARVS
jgi:myo-inositol 2-dehydrogenase/D-chiro-inositol 1-dehydrogenase/scyllo-inositol 2-dehydrogenase (NAD+)